MSAANPILRLDLSFVRANSAQVGNVKVDFEPDAQITNIDLKLGTETLSCCWTKTRPRWLRVIASWIFKAAATPDKDTQLHFSLPWNLGLVFRPFSGHKPKFFWNARKKLGLFGHNVRKYRLSEYCYGEFQYCYGKNDQNVSAKKETQLGMENTQSQMASMDVAMR